MLKIAVVTWYFPTRPSPGAQVGLLTLRVLAHEAEVRVLHPNAAYPFWLKPRSRNFYRLDASFSLPEVKVSYYDYPALPGCEVAARAPPASRSEPSVPHLYF